jgi:hypothetical protein
MIVHNPLTAIDPNQAQPARPKRIKQLNNRPLSHVKLVRSPSGSKGGHTPHHSRETCPVVCVKPVRDTPLKSRETCRTSNYLILLPDSITDAVKEKMKGWHQARPSFKTPASSFFFHQRGFPACHSLFFRGVRP